MRGQPLSFAAAGFSGSHFVQTAELSHPDHQETVKRTPEKVKKT
jgi:hypothetical protein